MPALEKLMDNELLALVSNDQRVAFHVIYDRYKLAMLAYASKRVSLDVAEDLVHDVFVKLWNNRKNIEFSNKFTGYLFTSLRNVIIDFIAKDHREQLYIDSLEKFALSFSYNRADDKLREELFLKNVNHLLKNFSEQYINIFELRFQGYSNSEIADKLGISEKTVRNKYSILTNYLKKNILLLILLMFNS